MPATGLKNRAYAVVPGSPEQVAGDLDRAARLGARHVLWNALDDDPLARLPLLGRLRAGTGTPSTPVVQA